MLAAGCNQAPESQTRTYQLTGQIVGMAPERREVTIRHEDIPNFMPGMTMPFTVGEAELLDGKTPGDLVTGTLGVGDTAAHLSTLTKTGHSPLQETAGQPAFLRPGTPVADAPLVDQSGAARPLSSLRGHRVALTFIYTRCPLPEFCPLMDRHFAAVQKALAGKPGLADVRLVSVTLDPEFDTRRSSRHTRRVCGRIPASGRSSRESPPSCADSKSSSGSTTSAARTTRRRSPITFGPP